MQLRQPSWRWCFRAKRVQRHNRRHQAKLQREGIDTAKIGRDEKGHRKGHENVPFWVLDGFVEIGTTLLE